MILSRFSGWSRPGGRLISGRAGDRGEVGMRKRFTVIGAMFLPVVAALSWLALADGGSFAAGKPPSTCSPSGPALAITASDNKFDKDCLAAPPGQAFTIDFDNKDYGLPP